MNHDFSALCADQLEKLEKRLKSLSKANIKEYLIGLHIINDETTTEHLNELMIGCADILSDANTKLTIIYTEALNKVQRCLSQHLVDAQ
jgi:hypothetical protein